MLIWSLKILFSNSPPKNGTVAEMKPPTTRTKNAEMNDLKLLEIYNSTFGINRPMLEDETDQAIGRMRRIAYYRSINIPLLEISEIIFEDWNICKDRREANHIAKKLVTKLANGHA